MLNIYHMYTIIDVNDIIINKDSSKKLKIDPS
jgi:hypothetical protein